MEIRSNFIKYYFETRSHQQLCFDTGSNICSKKGNIFGLRFLSAPWSKITHDLSFDTKFSSPSNVVMDQKKPHKFSANHVPYVLEFAYLTNLHTLHILLLL